MSDKQKKKLAQTIDSDERAKEVFFMYYHDHKNCKEIGKELGIHLTTAWRAVMRGKRLRDKEWAEEAKDYTQANLARLETMLDPHWPKAAKGNVKAAGQVRSNIREMQKILGTDKTIIEIRVEKELSEEVRKMLDHLEKRLDPQEYSHVVQALGNMDGSETTARTRSSIEESLQDRRGADGTD